MYKRKIFISHSWSYSDVYDSLINILNNARYFDYQNYSVPKNDPIHNASSDYALREAIEKQIKWVDAVIVVAGVYSTYSKWINIEIDIAKQMGKTIIAVAPWGSTNISSVVRQSADIIVGWNGQSIANAIKRL
ncbi:MAG: TIR domain-containing protein [Mycoplasma sp.]